MAPNLKLSGSLEDYLEAIYLLVKRDHQARATQLAEKLNVKKSSVTVALRALEKKKLINYAPYSDISLTTEGKQTAEDIIRRHETLKEFLVNILDVEETSAEEGACKMEHVFSKEMTDKLIKFMEFVEICPRHGMDWIGKFHQYCNDESRERFCQECTHEVTEKVKKMISPNKALDNAMGLNRLEPKQKAEIIKVNHRGAFRKRILEMGVTTGAVLTVERVAPLGDPIDIKIRGYHLSLRKEEAKNISVKVLD